MKEHLKPVPKLAEEAAEWLVRLDDEVDPQTRVEFLAWVQQSPVHLKEFLYASEAFRELDDLDPNGQIDVPALLAEGDNNVVRLPDAAPAIAESSGRAPVGSRGRRKPWFVAAMAATLASLAVIGMYSLTRSAQSGELSTALGEQRSYKLDDGSVMHLNARSRVQIDFSKRQRHIRLLEGEGLFVVANDPARPFSVSTATTTVQALGTQFNVYQRGTSTLVSVVEGSVSVSGAATAPDQTLRAGEQVTVAKDGHIKPLVKTDISKATAWRSRRLVFQDTPLQDVAEEFNRYNAVQIQVEDPKAREKQLIGVFNADDPASLLLFLQKDRSLVVEREANRLVIRSR